LADVIEQDEVESQPTPEKRAAERVKKDFERAKIYLREFHQHCNDRYEHYIAPSRDSNPDADNSFPVPFTTEQIDQFVADGMDKLWYKDEPCSIYGRNETDKADADAKREFIKYQDIRDDIKAKTRMALFHCALYRIAPAVVNYKEEFTKQEVLEEQQLYYDNKPVMGMDGVTPLTVPMPVMKDIPVYQGATIELVDPLDFYWTPEKREPYDEHPLMIKSRKSMDWLKKQPYILKSGITELEARMEQRSDEEGEDLLEDRRGQLGFKSDKEHPDNLHTYVEWQGWFSPEPGGEKKLYILGWIEGTDICVRMQDHDEIFGLGKPNIIVGVIGRYYGEIYGPSLADKFHSVQHGMDSLMGVWFKNLRQTGNNMWIGNANKIKTKDLKNKPGLFIDCLDDPDKVLKRVDPAQISGDVYKGIAMFRQMGQNGSGQNEISGGQAQEGVETLGEASILTSQSALRMKGGYLSTFETSFIQPCYTMRNDVNMRFVTDVGYLYSVIEENIMNWRTATPAQIRAGVDFICEASNRENQRQVVTQQIKGALDVVMKLIPFTGPIPAIKLLQKLYEEGFGWKQDSINELLPPELIVQQIMEKQMLEQQEREVQQQATMAKSGGGGAKPRTDADMIENTNAANRPQVGEMG